MCYNLENRKKENGCVNWYNWKFALNCNENFILFLGIPRKTWRLRSRVLEIQQNNFGYSKIIRKVVHAIVYSRNKRVFGKRKIFIQAVIFAWQLLCTGHGYTLMTMNYKCTSFIFATEYDLSHPAYWWNNR